MDREEARRRAETMIAFANGSDVQFYNGVTKQWEDIRPECVLFESTAEYRVKPEPKCRPFKTQEECWNEMLKHQPFGYLRYMEVNKIVQITGMETASNGELRIDLSINRHMYYTTIGLFEVYTFTDGAPFGIKEE